MDLKTAAENLMKVAESLEVEASQHSFFICSRCNHTATLATINDKRKKIAAERNVKNVNPVTVNDKIACPACDGTMSYVQTEESAKYYVEAADEPLDMAPPSDTPPEDTEDPDKKKKAPKKPPEELDPMPPEDGVKPEGEGMAPPPEDTEVKPPENIDEMPPAEGMPGEEKPPMDEGVPGEEKAPEEGMPGEEKAPEDIFEPVDEQAKKKEEELDLDFGEEGEKKPEDMPPEGEGMLPPGGEGGAPEEVPPVTEEEVPGDFAKKPKKKKKDEDVEFPKGDVPKFEKMPKEASEVYSASFKKYMSAF
jgi:hypothetical protein